MSDDEKEEKKQEPAKEQSKNDNGSESDELPRPNDGETITKSG